MRERMSEAGLLVAKPEYQWRLGSFSGGFAYRVLLGPGGGRRLEYRTHVVLVDCVRQGLWVLGRAARLVWGLAEAPVAFSLG